MKRILLAATIVVAIAGISASVTWAVTKRTHDVSQRWYVLPGGANYLNLCTVSRVYYYVRGNRTYIYTSSNLSYAILNDHAEEITHLVDDAGC